MQQISLHDIFFIVFAVRWTLLLSAIAFTGGAVGGLVVALAQTSDRMSLRYLSFAYIKIFQGTPLLMQLFLAFFAPSLFGYNLDALTAAALGLSLNASAFLGDIWAGCIKVVPRGQLEAAKSLGLKYVPRMFLIIMPQAFQVAIPPTVGFLVQLIKGTSLAAIIGFVELTQAAEEINNATFRPFYIFGLVGLMYFILCWPLSSYSSYMERKVAIVRR
jgi:polar amino acid transport system permease protein